MKNMRKEYDYNSRYYVYEEYNGLFDDKMLLCTTESLFNAVYLVEIFNEIRKDNPCYSYSFKKVATDLDPVNDYFPGKTLCDKGFVYKATTYEEFRQEREKNESAIS